MDPLMRVRRQWDRSAAVGLSGLGVILLVVGWFGVRGTVYAAEQVPYVISCGIGGLFALGAASVLWLSADLQDEWRKLDALEAALRERPLAAPLETTPLETTPLESPLPETHVIVRAEAPAPTRSRRPRSAAKGSP